MLRGKNPSLYFCLRQTGSNGILLLGLITAATSNVRCVLRCQQSRQVIGLLSLRNVNFPISVTKFQCLVTPHIGRLDGHKNTADAKRSILVLCSCLALLLLLPKQPVYLRSSHMIAYVLGLVASDARQWPPVFGISVISPVSLSV